MISNLAKNTCKQFVYIDVIYFFVMHETSVHTVFELLEKNIFLSFHALYRKAIFNGESVVIKLHWPKVCFMLRHVFIQQIFAEDLLRTQPFCC